MNEIEILNMIDKIMVQRNAYQGEKYKKTRFANWNSKTGQSKNRFRAWKFL